MFLGMKKLSIFNKLEYWKDLLVIHLLDHMSIVNNVAYSLCQYTIIKELDISQVIYDLNTIETKHSLWVNKNLDGTINVPSLASWIMTKDEVNILYNLVKTIKTPTRYVLSL